MRPVRIERRQRIATACLACLAAGPAFALAIALHSLEHDGLDHPGSDDRRDEAAAPDLSHPPLGGPVHTEGPDHHRHEVPPPALESTPPTGQSRFTVVAATDSTGMAADPRTARGQGPLVAAAAHDPPAPSGLLVLRL
jgi:hypothetical protein